MESPVLMYGFGGLWNIPAAPVHKAFADINAAANELRSFVGTQPEDEMFQLLDLITRNLADSCYELELAMRGKFSRKAHRIAGAPYPSVQVYPYGSSVEAAPKVFNSSGKSLDEVLIYDRIEDLLESQEQLVQCEGVCLGRIAGDDSQEELAQKVDVVIGSCEGLEESIRGEFSRKARRQRIAARRGPVTH
jgi:hypothetical protein